MRVTSSAAERGSKLAAGGHASDLRPGAVARGRLLIVLAPVLALVAVTAAMALGAWLLGWYRHEMLLAAMGAGGAVVLVAVILLYGQLRRQRAARLALQNAEARLRGIVEAAMDAIITVDDHQRIVLFNAAAEAMFGWPRKEALGEPLSSFMPERFRAAHADQVRRFGEGSIVSRRMGALRIVTGLRRNGEEFPIDASISHISEGGRKFFTVILRDVTARVRAEEALRRSKDELHALASAAHRAREQEKQRIARELHDELGQALTALQMDVAWCRERVSPAQEGVAARLGRIASLLETTVAATRRISADLRPLMLDDLGLEAALEWLVENFNQRTGVRCDLSFAAEGLELPDMEATAIFRAVQESLTNVAKHARASRVDVTIEREDSMIFVRIRDDGIGFSAEKSAKPGSFGLLGLRERAALLGGDAQVTSAPGRGTEVEVRLPVPGLPVAEEVH